MIDMTLNEIDRMLAEARIGRLCLAEVDGRPYCIPLPFCWTGGALYLRLPLTGRKGTILAENDRVCFEVDEPGAVFAYGRFECDTAIAYASVIAFGRIRVVEDRTAKEAFCRALMSKYAPADGSRPQGFFPRLAQISVYAIGIERLTGKATPLPAAADRWPAADLSKTPNARPPMPGFARDSVSD